MNNLKMGRTEWFLLVLLSVIWGGSFFFNEVILRELRPLTIVMGRTILAAIALLILVYGRGGKMPASPRIWFGFAVMGLLNNIIPFSLIVWGQTQIDSGLASILNATTPLFSIVLAHFLSSDERLTVTRFAGILLGLFGIVILIGPQALQGIGLTELGQIAVLGAALAYALAGIWGRRFKGLPSLVPAAGMVTCSALLMIPVATIVEQPWGLRPDAITWVALLGLSLLSTAIAYLIYFRILATAGATNLMLVTFLIPASAILLGVLFLGEQISWSLVAGMLFIFAGLLAVDGRILKR